MPQRKMSFEEIRVRNWITSKRGVLSEVAVECDCCHQYVQQVAYGKSTSLPGNKVEFALRKRGWPGIKRSRS